MTYYGITIGPVFDTILLASKPLGLWLSSYMFSHFSYTICAGLNQAGVAEQDFYSPAFKVEDKETAVGKYPDRIIFRSDLSRNEVEKAIEQAVTQMQDEFEGTGVDIKNYLIHHVVELTDEEVNKAGNAIRAFASILDSVELNQSLNSGTTLQNLRHLLSNNDKIKKLKLFKDLEESHIQKTHLLDDKHQVTSLQDLTLGQKYYAIIQADGDGVGQLINRLNDEEVLDFSRKLLKFSEQLTEELQKLGGSLIYAGGDDLLALAPANPEGTDWLQFANKLNKLLKETLENSEVALSMSVTICYYKYPLYEALKKAANQLFGVAKGEQVGKGAVVFHVEKHSGQLIDFIVKYDWQNGLYEKLLTNLSSSAQNNSILYHLMNNKLLFEKALDDYYENKGSMLDNLFENYFNHVSQEEEGAKSNRELALAILKELGQNDGLRHIASSEVKDSQKALDYLTQIMRYRRFIIDIGGEKDGK